MWQTLTLCMHVCAHVCRFSADAEVDLKAPLSALGIRDMFSQDKADFRHLSEWKHRQSKPKSGTMSLVYNSLVKIEKGWVMWKDWWLFTAKSQ